MADSFMAKLFSAIESGKRRVRDSFTKEGLDRTGEMLNQKLENLTSRDPDIMAKQALELVGGGGALGTIGSASRVLGSEAAAQAERLIKLGTKADDVFDATKVFASPLDKKLRANISDANYDLKPKFREAKTLGEAISHPELFKLYPELRDLPFQVMDLPKGTKAAFGGDKGVALSRSATDAEAFNSIIHEVQHGIQKVEGFTGGSNIGRESVSKDFMKGIQDPNTIQQMLEYKKLLNDPRPLTQVLAEKLYRLVGGEAEARAVQEQLLQRNWTANPYKRIEQGGMMDVNPNFLRNPGE